MFNISPLFYISILVSGTVFFILAGLYKWLSWTRQVDERFEASLQTRYLDEWGGKANRRADLEKRFSTTSLFNNLRQDLLRAGLRLTVYEFLAIRLGVTIMGMAGGWAIAQTPLAGVLLAILGWILPGLWLRNQLGKRRKAFDTQLTDVLNLLVSSLQAGYGLQQALSIIVKEMPDPAAEEFSRVLKEAQLGYSLNDALDHLVTRMQSDDLALIVTAIHIQSEVGGSLAEVIQSISETILERIRINGEIQTLTAEQRMSGTILTALPFLLGTLFMLLNPDYMMEMFQPGWPLIIPIAATMMTIIGYLMMRSMLKLDF